MRQRLSAVLLVLVSGSPAWADNLIFMDRFNNGLGAWALDQTGGTVTISTVTNSTKMVLDDTSGSAVVSATRSFAAPSERYNLEFDALYASGASLSAQLLDASDRVMMSVDITGGTISFGTDATTAATEAWPTSVYKQVTLTVDPAGYTVRCYITRATSKRLADEQVQVGATKPYSGTTIAKVRFITGSSATGASLIDEVRIYRPHIFVMGDSIAAGKLLWANDPGSTYRQQAGNSETSPPHYQLGLLLSDGNEWVANRGFGGAGIGDVCARLQLMAVDQGAQKIILHVGHNDVAGGRTLSQMQASLDGCLSALARGGLTGDEVTLSNILPSIWLTADPQRTIRAEYNHSLLSICERNGYTCSDSSSLLADPSNPTVLRASYDGGDGTHLSAAGNVALAQSWLGSARASGQYRLTVTPAGAGSGTTTGAGIYHSGQTATVTATANTGSSVTGWSGPDGAECATGSVLMTADKNCVATFTLTPHTLTVPTAGNISTRAFVGTDSNVAVGGFIIGGTGSKAVLIRGFGPTLADFGVTGALANPVLELFWDDDNNPNTPAIPVLSNDDWGLPLIPLVCTGIVFSPPVMGCGTPQDIANTGLSADSYAPSNPNRHLDAALLVALLPGTYTVNLSGLNDGTGVGLIGVDDVDAAQTATLINLSTRAFVGTDSNVAVGGFIISGASTKQVLLRGFGPTLTSFGVTGALANPTLALEWDDDNNPNTPAMAVISNDNWVTPLASCPAPVVACGTPQDIIDTGMSADSYAPSNPNRGLDSALLVTLQPGTYTATLRGVGTLTGVGLFGVDEIAP